MAAYRITLHGTALRRRFLCPVVIIYKKVLQIRKNIFSAKMAAPYIGGPTRQNSSRSAKAGTV